jgi:hypothetical protein
MEWWTVAGYRDRADQGNSIKYVSTLLKDCSHKLTEKPSKDRSKRFAAGKLYTDKQLHKDHA